MSSPFLAIIGINEDGYLPPDAIALLRAATLVVGGQRHLALAAPHITAPSLAWPSPLTNAIPTILAHRPHPVAVLASGDPGWFGVATLLLRHIPLIDVQIIPAPSSFALAAARLGWPLQDVQCLSCCGRPVAALIPHLHGKTRLLVLSADATTPAAISSMLIEQGFANSTIFILESLGGPAERIRQCLPTMMCSDINPLNLLAIDVKGQGCPLTPGLDEARFDHDGQITKREIRAMTLAALAPRPGELLWDIGCGSGSIAIEWMRQHPQCRAIGIERDPVRAARARRNAAALGTPGLTVMQAEAPAGLRDLPPPDAIFIGGGAHHPAMVETAWSALPKGGRIVANAIALATEAALIAAQAIYGGTLTRIAIERLDRVGGMPAFRPAMTVTQWQAAR